MKVLCKKIRCLAVLALLLGFMPMLATGHCPRTKDIERIDGTYKWEVKLKKNAHPRFRWVGFFAHPFKGKGYSTEVKRFVQAKWIKVNNLAKSPGYIECDYAGNYENEVIRFTMDDNLSVPEPGSAAWVHSLNAKFPSVAATCNATPVFCKF